MIEARPPRVRDAPRLLVEATGALEASPEPALDELAALAAELTWSPYAFVTLVDDRRLFWKTRVGVDPDGPTQNRVAKLFGQYVISAGESSAVDDVTTRPLASNNASVVSMGVRAWAGFPLLSASGRPLGSICVLDTRIRNWTQNDVDGLRVL